MAWGNTTVRLAGADDLDSVLEVVALARQESPLGAQVCTPETPELSRYLAAWFATEGTSLAIAENDDRVVGVALAEFVDVNLFTDLAYMQIEALFVHPDYRRRGVGRELMRQVAVTAADRGAERVVTIVLTGARSEQRFLSGLGFSPVAFRRIAETGALLRRLETPARARERRGGVRGVPGLDEIIARRRRSRGLPPTPSQGIGIPDRQPGEPADGGAGQQGGAEAEPARLRALP